MIRKEQIWAKRQKINWRLINLTKVAEMALVFLLGVVLSTAEIFGRCMPFGVAWVASTGSGLLGFTSLLGSVIGYLLLGAKGYGIHYAGASVLTFTACLAFREMRMAKHPLFMPIAAAVFCALSNVLYLSTNIFYEANVIFHTTEVFLLAGIAYLYRPLFTKGDVKYSTKEINMASMALCATVLLALVGVEVWYDVSFGRVCSILCLLVLANRGGVLGLTSGCLIGLLMDISSGRGPYYTMIFSVCGAVSGLFSRYSKTVFTLIYVVINAVVMLWTWESGMRVGLLYETFLASVIYYVLPKAWEEKTHMLFKLEKEHKMEWDVARERALHRVKQTANAFRELYDNMRQSISKERDNPENAMEIFSRMEERVCRRCINCERCLQAEFEDTRRVYNDALQAMMSRGRAVPDDFSSHFRSRCIHFQQLLVIANEELIAFLQRRQYQSKLKENRLTLCNQYAQFDQILMQTASELSTEFTPDYRRQERLQEFLDGKKIKGKSSVYYDDGGRLQVETPKHRQLHKENEVHLLEKSLNLQLKDPVETEKTLIFSQEEPFAVMAGIFAKSKDSDSVNGDTGTWFRREDGLVCILLCDGMGSGEEARAESALAVRLLEKFLKAGMAPKWALSTVNSALAIRGEQSGACTTVDLLTIELYTGVCSVYKFGACPTYLRKSGAVSSIKGSMIPAGLIAGEDVEAEVTQVRLQHNDWVILASDGIISDDSDGCIREVLANYKGKSPGELSKILLEETQKKMSESDDATVIAVRLKQKTKEKKK